MGKIRIAHDNAPWMVNPVAGDQPGEGVGGMVGLVEARDEDDVDAFVRIHHPGSNTELQLIETRVRPNGEIAVHAHEVDEIMYVLSGELRLGARRLGPGCSVLISALTLYGIKAGPAGLTFLNFRASEDPSFLSRQDLQNRRVAGGRPPAGDEVTG